MIQTKRFIILSLCIFLLVMPCITNYEFSYADGGSWTAGVDENGFVAAMKAYAKMNDKLTTTIASVTYHDPINAAMAEWSYNSFKKAADAANINLSDLQNSIKYRVSNNGTLEFLYAGDMIQYYNALIRQYMIQNGIDPDDESSQNVQAYNGEYFRDYDGYGCYVTSNLAITGVHSSMQSIYEDIDGSFYKYTGRQMYNLATTTSSSITEVNRFTEDVSYSYYFSNASMPSKRGTIINGSAMTVFYADNNSTYRDINSGMIIARSTSNNHLYLCAYNKHEKVSDSSTIIKYFALYDITAACNNDAVDAAINIAKNGLSNAGITPGNDAAISAGQYGSVADDAVNAYLNDQESNDELVDNNVQDEEPVYENQSLPSDPTDPQDPQGGDSDPDYNPTGGIQLSDGTFNFKMPDLNINWSLDGLQNKFPISIPWDMIRLAQALDVPAETPEFDYTVNFPTFSYRFDFDLSIFDQVMVYLRIVLEVLYTFGLIIGTRQIFHIY